MQTDVIVQQVQMYFTEKQIVKNKEKTGAI